MKPDHFAITKRLPAPANHEQSKFTNRIAADSRRITARSSAAVRVARTLRMSAWSLSDITRWNQNLFALSTRAWISIVMKENSLLLLPFFLLCFGLTKQENRPWRLSLVVGSFLSGLGIPSPRQPHTKRDWTSGLTTATKDWKGKKKLWIEADDPPPVARVALFKHAVGGFV